MTLKEYYREMEAILATIEEPFVVVISLQTPNGGRAGVASEVGRETAARLVVEGKARLASGEEVARMRQERDDAKRLKDIAELQERVRMTRLAEDELKALKKAMQSTRKGE
jgi:hypothetical protein